jgi:ketosteroid isomerase-like protein
MSQEDVEIMRAAYELWAEGGVEAVLPLVAEAFELRPPPGSPGVGPFRGHEGLRAAFLESRDVFADVRMRPERFIDLDGQILVLGKVLVRSKGAEVEMEVTLSHLWTMREGKVTVLQIYGDPQRALEAAGLRE